MNIYNTSQNNLIAENVKVADNFVSRSVGLLFKKNINVNEALIIRPCNSIHTYFMKFDIDVVFVNKKNEVVAVYKNVKPFKVLPIHWNSRYVIEIKAGGAQEKNIKMGDKIQVG